MLGSKNAANRRRDFAFFAALLVQAALFHRQVLFYPGYLFPWDFRAVHIPFATLIADSFRRGEFPLWDPYTYCGQPVFANIQAALFYPPALIATAAGVLLGDNALPRLLAIAAVMQIVFAAICTYLLMKRIGSTSAAAWIAATVYELGCFFAAQGEHMGILHAGTWLPLCWLCVIEMRGGGFRWRWIGTLSFALAMTVLAGSPACAAGVFGSTLGLAVILRVPLQVLIAWVWALLLAAVQFIPTAELTANSVAKYRYEWLKTGGGMSPGALITLVLPNYWSTFDLAKYHGPGDVTFTYLYSSLLGLALAVAAMVWKPDRWSRIFAVMLVLAAFAMFGDTTPVGRTVLNLLPANYRIGLHPEYTYCNFSLALALLAGLSANRLLKTSRLQIAAGVAIALDLVLVSSGRPMSAVSTSVEPGINHDTEIVTRLRSLTNTTSPPSRFDMRPTVSYLWSSLAPVLDIPTANGCDPLAPERMIQVRLSFAPGARWGTCYQVVNPNSPVLGLANVRYLLSVENGAYRIDENPTVLPRFFFPKRVQTVAGLTEAAELLHAPDFDPADVAIVETPAGQLATGAGTVRLISYAASAVTVETNTATEAFLVMSDAYYPGWEARIDGKRTKLYITDVAFRGIQVPAGDHQIEMRFVPRILYRSAAISATALLALLLLATVRSGRGSPS